MTLLTFRLDLEFRQRLRTRLAEENRSLSEIVILGLQRYIEQDTTVQDVASTPRPPQDSQQPATTAVASVADLALPGEIVRYLRDLHGSRESELLSATLARLYEKGWPLRPLATALGISRQAVLARVQQRVRPEIQLHVLDVPPPTTFPRRRPTLSSGRRPHFTIRIDQALRAAAHREAQREGRSLSQVIERILDQYLHHGLPTAGTKLGDIGATRRVTRRSRRTAP